MTMLQIHHIEAALHKAILEMDKPGTNLTGFLSDFRPKYIQLCRAKDKSEWIQYDSFIPWRYQRDILYEFFSEEAKFLLMLEN